MVFESNAFGGGAVSSNDTEILDARMNNTWESGRSFTLRHLAVRVSWNFVWLVLAAWTPPPLHAWRRFLLRLYGAKIAAGAGVYGSARIWYPANLEMEASAFIGARVNCYCMAKVTLGAYSLVSQGAHLCAGTHDIEDPHFQLLAQPIRIDRRAWIAADAFVGPGVRVGEGAVLGARGVALKDLDAWTVYAGNPARPIKPRNVRFPDNPQARS
jgi:putative colanic acid biosynthesis acetyltransferase WcaF